MSIRGGGFCETARLAIFFASPRHFDFLDCETETSKCFESKRERETLDLVESSENELANQLVQKSYKGAVCCKTLVRDIRSENLSTVNKFYQYPVRRLRLVVFLKFQVP